MITTDLFESQQLCPECGGPAFSDLILAEKKDACYNKVRSRYKVWPSAYASGALVQCRKKGAANWGNKSESLNEFAPGGDEGNSPYAYAIALKEMARLYAEGAFDYDLAPGSKAQNESDAEDISQVADAFMNQGMEAGREAYNMVDTGVRDEMDSYLKDQGFNVQNDIHAEYQKDVERYQNSPQGQAQAQAQAAKNTEYAKGAPARKANEVVISAVDATTGEEEFSKISFDRGSVSPEQLRAKIQRSVAELKQHFVDYPGRNPSEKIIKVTIGGKPVDIDKGIAEGHDNGEYSDEAGMAHGNLITIAKAARGLLDTIDQHEDLPEWVQEKIAKVEGMLVSAWNYLQSQEAQGIDPRITEVYGTLAEAWSHVRHRMELTEEFDIIQRVVSGLAEHNGVDQEVIWEDLESLTDDELYVFAVTTPIMEDWQKANKRDRTDGMSRKAVKAYRREHPGSKLQTAVTTKPSKLKKGSKASKRRKSYCSRSRGQMKMHHISCAKTPDKAICKARRRWNCESMEHSGTMVAEAGSPAQQAAIAIAMKKAHKKPKTEGVEEAFIAPALSAANANAEHRRQGAAGGGYRGRIDIPVQSREDYRAAGLALKKAAAAAGQKIEYGLSNGVMSVFSDSMTADELDQFIDHALYQGLEEMDKSQPSHGRDGKISHSTYGSRDKGGSQGMDRTARMTTADRMMRDAEKKFLKHMSNADKVKKGWRNPNIDEGMDDTVAFEIDSENAYNHVMKRFGSVIDWDGDAMVVPRRYWPAVQEVAHDAGGAATEYGTEGMAEGFPHDVDHMPGPRIKNPQTGCKRCHGKGYVYKTADGKVLPSNEQGAKRYKCGACGGIGFVKQGVAEVSDETLTSYLSKVHADSQKHDRDPSKRSPAKRNKSVQGFSRAFNKLDARKSQTDEGLADDFMKLAQARGINARLRGTPEQERARSQQILAQRAKDRAAQPAPEGPSPERRAELQAKLKELEAQFDPNYEYSDDHSFWSRQHALAQQIQGIRQQLSITEISKQKLGDYLHAAHQDVVDRASSSSFQSGQAGDRYNRADVSPKERQRQAGMQRAITRLTREGSSMAEAWARRYPNINADIAECKSSGDGERLKRLMSIKDIIDSDLREQSGLGFGE